MKHPRTPVLMTDHNIDEIRRIRAKLSARFDNDVGRLCEYLRAVEMKYADRVVHTRKRRTKDQRRVAARRQA